MGDSALVYAHTGTHELVCFTKNLLFKYGLALNWPWCVHFQVLVGAG